MAALSNPPARNLTEYTGLVVAANDRGLKLQGQPDWWNYSGWGKCRRANVGETVRVEVDAKGWMRDCQLVKAAPQLQEPEPEYWDPEPAPPPSIFAGRSALAILNDEPEPAPAPAVPPAPVEKPAPSVPQLRPYDLAVIRMSAVKSATAYVTAAIGAGQWTGKPVDVLALAVPLAQWMSGEISDEAIKPLFIAPAEPAQIQEPAPTKRAVRSRASASA